MNASIFCLQRLLVGLSSSLPASFVTTYSHNRYQRLREDYRWHKEKLFDAYNQCISAAVAAAHLARMPSTHEISSRRTDKIVELSTSLNILVVFSSKQQKEAITAIRDEVDQLLQQGSNFLLNIKPELLENIRNRLVHLMQNDQKLKEFS